METVFIPPKGCVWLKPVKNFHDKKICLRAVAVFMPEVGFLWTIPKESILKMYFFV